MDFVIARGFDLARLAPDLDHLAISRLGLAPCEWQGPQLHVLSSGEMPRMADGKVCVFDGYASLDGTLVHSLLKPDPTVAAGLVRRLLDGRAVDGGVFAAGAFDARGGCLRTDALGQYPIFWVRRGGDYLVSNNVHLLAAAAEIGELSLTRSMIPAIDFAVYGGPVAGATQFVEVRALLPGQWLRFDERGVELVADYETTAALVPEDPIEDLVDQVVAATRRHVLSLAEGVPDAVAVADITGGAHSRAALAIVLSTGAFPDLTGRCITRYPHPDANVAGHLMKKLGLQPGPYPVPLTLRPAARQVAIIRRSAFLNGGAKMATALSPFAVPDLVHFGGACGELGGDAVDVDFVSTGDAPGGPRFSGAVRAFVERRDRAGATSLLTSAAVADFGERLRRELCYLSDLGVAREHLAAELYLRTRCRTHFGLRNYYANKTMIQPDILGTHALVDLRRALPVARHRANEAMLSIILATSPELAFLPMITPWDRSIVPADKLADREAMQVADRSTPEPGEDDGPLYRLVPVRGFGESADYLGSSAASPRDLTRAQFASGPALAGNQVMLGELLDVASAGHEVWDLIDRSGVEAAARRASDGFRTGIQVDTLAGAAMGLVWMLGLEEPIQVTTRLTMRGLLAAEAARNDGGAG